MEYIMRIEALPEQSMLYMRRVGPYGEKNYPLMERMKRWALQRGLLGAGSVLYAIAHDNVQHTPPQACRYDVC